MKIAVTHAGGEIFTHFGHTEEFKIYTVESGRITSAEVVGTNGKGHGALAEFLSDAGVDTLICGGIGGGAQIALGEAGIRIFGGVSGSCDEAVEALLNGNLGYDPNARCSHHEHDHEHGEACGHHSCGGHCSH